MLEDRSAEIELIVFARQYAKYISYLLPETPITVRGTISVKDEERATVIVNDCSALLSDDRFSATSQKLYLRVPSASSPVVKSALALLGDADSGAAVVLYDVSAKQYVKAVDRYANLTEALLKKLFDLLGEGNVVIK